MIILASSSPRRQQLLKKITSDFKICVSNIDENEPFLSSSTLSYDLPKLKAYEIYKNNPDDVVIACDTIVVFNNKVFGKPRDEKEAKEMLTSLSNNTHIVLTSYTIISKYFEISRTIKSRVTFNSLSEKTIDEYIKTGSPMDKAGAYGCQDERFNLIKNINGSFDNVMGFPTESIKKELKRLRVL